MGTMHRSQRQNERASRGWQARGAAPALGIRSRPRPPQHVAGGAAGPDPGKARFSLSSNPWFLFSRRAPSAPASPPAPIRNEPRQEFSLAPETETRSGLRLAPVLRDSRLSRDIVDCVRVRFALQRERGQERRFLKVESGLELLADFSRHAEPFALLRRKPKTRILLC